MRLDGYCSRYCCWNRLFSEPTSLWHHARGANKQVPIPFKREQITMRMAATSTERAKSLVLPKVASTNNKKQIFDGSKGSKWIEGGIGACLLLACWHRGHGATDLLAQRRAGFNSSSESTSHPIALIHMCIKSLCGNYSKIRQTFIIYLLTCNNQQPNRDRKMELERLKNSCMKGHVFKSEWRPGDTFTCTSVNMYCTVQKKTAKA